jgi:Helix-turn-helix domain
MKENQEIQLLLDKLLGSDVQRRLLLTPREVSKLLKRAEQTLANDRFAGRGLPYVKIGRSVRYKLVDILALVESRYIDPEEH